MTDANRLESCKISIASLNDRLRSCVPLLPKPHMMVLTEGVRSLSGDDLGRLFSEVRGYRAFTSDNDPHSEHDFASIEMNCETYFWKFDYYDEDFKYFKENGTRVLTLMTAAEY